MNAKVKEAAATATATGGDITPFLTVYVPKGADEMKPRRKLQRMKREIAKELPEGTTIMGLLMDAEAPPVKSIAVVVAVEDSDWQRQHALLLDLLDELYPGEGSDAEVVLLHTFGRREDGSWVYDGIGL